MNSEFCGRAKFCWREPATLFPVDRAGGNRRSRGRRDAARRLGLRAELCHAAPRGTFSRRLPWKDSAWSGTPRRPRLRARSCTICARRRRSARASPRISALIPSLRPAGAGLEHLDRIAYYEQQDAMILDAVTARNLELVEPATGDDASATLLRAIDETATGMGARLLRRWILRPEISLAEIEARLDAVAELKSRTIAREEIRKTTGGNPRPRAADEPRDSWEWRRRAICSRCEGRSREFRRCDGSWPCRLATCLRPLGVHDQRVCGSHRISARRARRDGGRARLDRARNCRRSACHARATRA